MAVRTAITCPLIRVGDTVAVRVGAGFDYPVMRDANHYWRGATGPSRASRDLVPFFHQRLEDLRRDALVKQQVAAIPGMIIEARNQVPRLEPRRFHRRL